MTYEEFMMMTESSRWHLVYQAVLAPAPACPKWDTMLFAKGQVYYASECSASRLEFEIKRAQESAAKGGEWAARDEKRAKALGYFHTWRTRFPTACWTGERNREQVTAAPPQQKPPLYDKTPRGAAAPTTTQSYGYEDDTAADIANDPDLPF